MKQFAINILLIPVAFVCICAFIAIVQTMVYGWPT